MSTFMLGVVCFIACHGAPADHFAAYAEELSMRGYEVEICASGPALKKFQERDITVKLPFSLDNITPEEEDRLAHAIAKTCSTASIIITDVGHRFDASVHNALNIHSPAVSHFAYYDNPEPFVPGGYSSTAAEVLKAADGALFANANLANDTIYSAFGKEIDLAGKPKFGIGYYPIDHAKKIAAKRKSEHDAARSGFLRANGIEDRGQRLFVYFGGNNEEYFTRAFPAFLSIVAEASDQTDLTNTIFVIQQHPGAKAANRDGQQVETWLNKFGSRSLLPAVILSDFSSDDAQVLADGAFYYQTSMGPQFVIAGIPAVQVGHETYEDILVRSHLAPSVTNAGEFADAIGRLAEAGEVPQENLLNCLGINANWPEELERALMETTLLINKEQ